MKTLEENHLKVIKDREEAAKKNQLIQTLLSQLGQLLNQIAVFKNLAELNIATSRFISAVNCLKAGPTSATFS